MVRIAVFKFTKSDKRLTSSQPLTDGGVSYLSKLSLSTKRLTEVNVEETVDHISVTAKLMLTVKAYKHVILGVLIEK